ncbi:hypothetical protein OF829_20465 [Sphingomonas sp. LB-2]|uniref:hypothetical protein n=1 Tax=Sphingomonas caeni TaxID=2984949 RepID=UPI00222EE967|nr:hypothetical protein [Sphingomonas caeni]MCW3849617.1 hypothetical protein [Sphingomonas caeni]
MIQQRIAAVDDYMRMYNGLREVEEVERELGRIGFFEGDFDRVARIFQRHSVTDIVGICLLHNHCSVTEGEIMVQRLPEVICGKPSLVTAPAAADGELAQASVPWSFRLESTADDGPFVPVEWSLDPLVQEDFVRLSGETAFLAELADALRAHGLTDLVGLALYRRAFEPAAPELLLIERSDTASRSNILTFDPDTEVGGETIQTIYYMGDLADSPMAGCTVVCQRLPHCVKRSPGHGREMVHTGQQVHSVDV